MKIETASLILRMHIALAGEGIGPDDPEPEDEAILAEALRRAGHLLGPHALRTGNLITRDELIHRLAGGES